MVRLQLLSGDGTDAPKLGETMQGFLRRRIQQGWTSQRAFAEAAEISLGSVEKILAGDHSMAQGRVSTALSRTLRVAPSVLAGLPWERVIRRPRAVVMLVCANSSCRRQFEWPAARKDQPAYHSRACYEMQQLGIARPTEPFNRAVFEAWLRSGLSVAAFARGIGVPVTKVRSTLYGNAPTQETYDALQGALGPGLPAVRTETERRREAANEMRKSAPAPDSKEFNAARQRAGEKMRGRKRDPEVVKRTQATRRATGVHESEVARLRALGEQQRIKAIRSLNAHLIHNPTPTREQIKDWSEETAKRFGFGKNGAAAVRILWKEHPRLLKLGMGSLDRGGRRADEHEHRHRIADQIKETWRRGPSGRPASGLWRAVAIAWARFETKNGATITAGDLEAVALSPDSAKRWYAYHVKRCPRGDGVEARKGERTVAS